VNISKEFWKKSIVADTSTLEQVVRNLDSTALKIAIVVNESLELVGTISDGDIRRGLLRGLSLKNQITDIVHRNSLVVPPEMGREMVTQLMVANKIQQIPVIDSRRQVVGLHLWDEIATTTKRLNTMVIMAGGMGTRLRPYTENCPKPMLLIAGKPMLELIIERAKSEGFRRFVLAIYYLGHMIEDYFGDGSRLQVEIKYLHEPSPLGTAGALDLLYPKPTLPFIVTNGDVITDIKYGDVLDFHTRQNAKATMAVRVHEWQNPFGVVQTKGVEIIGFEEKPISRSHVNAGVYVLEPSALNYLSHDCHCDMPTLFERLQEKSCRIVAYPMHEPWLDVGRPEDLQVAVDTIDIFDRKSSEDEKRSY
jgi:dTDP-glucose pyrophosphorylase